MNTPQESDLEKRLAEILNHHRNGLTPDQHRIPIKDSIAQILTAIKDAGYIQLPPEVEEMWRTYNHMAGYKTGAEWYARFEKELAGKVFPYIKDDNEVTTTLQICQDAAKRAAGVDN